LPNHEEKPFFEFDIYCLPFVENFRLTGSSFFQKGHKKTEFISTSDGAKTFKKAAQLFQVSKFNIFYSIKGLAKLQRAKKNR